MDLEGTQAGAKGPTLGQRQSLNSVSPAKGYHTYNVWSDITRAASLSLGVHIYKTETRPACSWAQGPQLVQSPLTYRPPDPQSQLPAPGGSAGSGPSLKYILSDSSLERTRLFESSGVRSEAPGHGLGSHITFFPFRPPLERWKVVDTWPGASAEHRASLHPQIPKPTRGSFQSERLHGSLPPVKPRGQVSASAGPWQEPHSRALPTGGVHPAVRPPASPCLCSPSTRTCNAATFCLVGEQVS